MSPARWRSRERTSASRRSSASGHRRTSAQLQAWVDRAGEFDWLIFTSAAGVEAFARRRTSPLPQLHIAVVGPATAQALLEHLGRAPELMPERYSGEALADALAQSAPSGAKMLVCAAQDARPALVLKLRTAGFHVQKIDAYTTVEAPPQRSTSAGRKQRCHHPGVAQRRARPRAGIGSFGDPEPARHAAGLHRPRHPDGGAPIGSSRRDRARIGHARIARGCAMRLLPEPTLVALGLRLAAGAVMAASIALSGYRLQALSASGAIAAVLIGALAFGCGGLLVAGAVVIFFLSASLLGRAHSPAADRARARAVKDSRRDAAQVIANGGAAALCSLLGTAAALAGWPSAWRWLVAAVCAVAAASGDTWSTEIGAFSPSSPRRIIDLKMVPAGTSGAITPLGTLAAPLGGAAVGLSGLARLDLLTLPAWLCIGALTGLLASAFDSLMGATLQARWECASCGQTIETPAARTLPQRIGETCRWHCVA